MNARVAWFVGAVVLLLALSFTGVGKAVVSYVSRGLRLNNPGNIRHNAANKWQGMSADQPDASFVKFDDPAYGVRALARVLLSYQKRGLMTVAGIIGTWAPSTENDTPSYVRHVADELHVAPDDAIDVRSYLPRLAAAIIEHENGLQPYATDDLKKWVYS